MSGLALTRRGLHPLGAADLGAPHGQQQVEDAVLGHLLRLFPDVLHLLLLHHAHGDLHEIADHGVHIAPHVTHFGKLRGLHLHKRRPGKKGQSPGDLCFSDTRGAYHEYIFRNDLFPQRIEQFLTANPIAQCDRHGLFGSRLTHDILVQNRHDALGRHRIRSVRDRLFRNDLIRHRLFSFHEQHAFRSDCDGMSVNRDLRIAV